MSRVRPDGSSTRSLRSKGSGNQKDPEPDVRPTWMTWPFLLTGAFIILILGGVLSVGLLLASRQIEDDLIDQQFDRAGLSISTSFQASLVSAVNYVRLAGMSVNAQNLQDMNNTDFVRFFDTIQASNPELYAMSYAPKVLRSERADFESYWNDKTNFASPFDGIFDSAYEVGGSNVVSGDRDEYYPILFSTAYPGALFFDFANPSPLNSRREAVIQCLETGEPVMTPVFRLSASPTSQQGIVVFIPFYSSQMPPSPTVEQRREYAVAAMSVVVSTGTLSLASLGPLFLEDLLVAWFDVSDNNPSFIVAAESSNQASPLVTLPAAASVAARADLRSIYPFELYSRSWNIHVYALPDFAGDRRSFGPYVMFGACVALTFVVIAFMFGCSHFLIFKAKQSVMLAGQRVRERVVALQASRAAHERTLHYACHELRNPLHGLSATAAEMYHDPSLTPSLRSDLDALSTAASTMHRLVNDVLDLAKLRAGKLELEPDMLSIETIIDPLLRQYQHLPNPGVIFKSSVSPSIPTKFSVDGLRVRQVLANGVTNALKHTKSGFVVIQATLYNKTATGGELLYQIIDTGPGLGSKTAAELFDPLGDADWSSMIPSESVRGLGILPPGVVDMSPPQAAEPRKSSPDQDPVGSENRSLGISAVDHAKQGSNFGLPIVFELVCLMKGSVGLTRINHRTVFWALLPFEDSVESTDTPSESRSTNMAETKADERADSQPRISLSERRSRSSQASDYKPNVRLPGAPDSPELEPAARLVPPSSPHNSLTDSSMFPRIPSVAPVSGKKPFVTGLSFPHSLGSELADEPGAGLRVLFVDDEPLNRRVGSRMLCRLGAQVTELKDGDEILGALQATGQVGSNAPSAAQATDPVPYDVLLTDVQMSRVNGDEACAQLRDLGLKLPIYAMTGNCGPRDIAKYCGLGFTGVIPKPFSAEDLSQRLKDIKTAKSLSSGPADAAPCAGAGQG